MKMKIVESNNRKIEQLAKKLLVELERQGKTLQGSCCGFIGIWIIDDRLTVENDNKWIIKCGEYKTKESQQIERTKTTVTITSQF